MNKIAYQITCRVFPSDDGYRWRIQLWIGNVDTMSSPTRVVESKVAYVAEHRARFTMQLDLDELLAKVPS